VLLSLILYFLQNIDVLAKNNNLYNMNIAQLSSSVIFITTINILTGEKLNDCKNPNDICLPYYVIPVHYQIKLTHLYKHAYDFYRPKLNIKNEDDSFNFYGKSSVTINILQSTQYIKLNKLNLRILNQLNITLIRNSGITYALTVYTEISEKNLIEFYFSNILYPGLYTFEMEYLGCLTENSANGFFKSFYTNEENGIA